MKAIVYERYGSPDVLELKEVERPTPNDNEVLVKVHAASLNRGDLPTLRGKPFLFRLMNGLRRPKHKILGDDIAGRIEAVGIAVKQFQPGDEVFGISNFGSFAEYRCVAEDNEPHQLLILKPANMSFEQAAAIPW
ncbi:unnamed protein product, partial [marine sediment metagenome]